MDDTVPYTKRDYYEKAVEDEKDRCSAKRDSSLSHIDINRYTVTDFIIRQISHIL
jgi:hypothetical protein